jgi:hypothetical protein
MKKLILNVKYFGIWGINKIYSLKDLRLDTPIPLPTMIIILVAWWILLTYLLIL